MNCVGGLLEKSFMQVVTNGDVNTLLNPGYFALNGRTANLPEGAYTFGTMVVFGVYLQRVVQMYLPDFFEADNKLYIRSINAGDKRAWRSITLT